MNSTRSLSDATKLERALCMWSSKSKETFINGPTSLPSHLVDFGGLETPCWFQLRDYLGGVGRFHSWVWAVSSLSSQKVTAQHRNTLVKREQPGDVITAPLGDIRTTFVSS